MDYAALVTAFDQLKRDGIVKNWAIAGGAAALYYVEPFVTFDVDVFVELVYQGSLVSLERFHARLNELGHGVKGEHVDIAGLPVQVIEPPPGLEAEALEQAYFVTGGAYSTRVVRAEHLMAICLKVGRPKDKLRLEMFLDEKAFNETLLQEILSRHGLLDKWQHYLKNRY